MSRIRRALRRIPGLHTMYLRGRRRARLWRWILQRLRGSSVPGQGALWLSGALDLLDATMRERRWAPRCWFPIRVIDRASGVELYVRAMTDDIYFALPRREGPVEEALLSPLREGDVAVDAGAHIGYYTVRMAQRVGPTGQVVSVEPNPETLKVLERNLSLNHVRNVRIVRSALGAHDAGEDALAAPRGLWGMTSTGPVPEGVGYPGSHAVATVPRSTLDRVCQDLERIRVIKLDIEGAELAAIESGTATLSRTDVLVCERNVDRSAIRDRLEALGFQVDELAFSTYVRASARRGTDRPFDVPRDVAEPHAAETDESRSGP